MTKNITNWYFMNHWIKKSKVHKQESDSSALYEKIDLTISNYKLLLLIIKAALQMATLIHQNLVGIFKLFLSFLSPNSRLHRAVIWHWRHQKYDFTLLFTLPISFFLTVKYHHSRTLPYWRYIFSFLFCQYMNAKHTNLQ